MHLRAEVSLPGLIYGSNYKLLEGEHDLRKSLRLLYEYVSDTTGERFEDDDEIYVCRVDFARDYQIGESNIVPTIKALSNIPLPRHHRCRIEDSTLYFNSRGKSRSKKIRMYGKHREILSKKDPGRTYTAAEGILRVEVSLLKTIAVNALVKKLGLSNRKAETILQPKIATLVFQEIEVQFPIVDSIYNEEHVFDILDKNFAAPRAMSLFGFMQYLKVYGADFHKLPKLKYGRTAYFNAMRDCRRVGIWPSE
jgi:hypothetical protein